MRRFAPVGVAAVIALAACAQGTVGRHELSCAGGTFSGAVLGGFVGDRFGKGRGNAILTALGAGGGGALGAGAAC